MATKVVVDGFVVVVVDDVNVVFGIWVEVDGVVEYEVVESDEHMHGAGVVADSRKY